MMCGYVRRGGRQCGRPAVAVMRHAVDTHAVSRAQLQPGDLVAYYVAAKGYPLCLDHLPVVVGDRPRPGLMTVIEWMS